MPDLRTELSKLTNSADSPTRDQRYDKRGKKGGRETCEPVAVRQLVDALGSTTAASEALGLAQSSVSSILSSNKTTLPVEKLAEMLLMMEGTPVKVERKRVLICRVPADKMEVVRAVLDAMHIKSYDFAD